MRVNGTYGVSLWEGIMDMFQHFKEATCMVAGKGDKPIIQFFGGTSGAIQDR